MIATFTDMVATMTEVLRENPQRTLTSEQRGWLDQLRQSFRHLQQRFSSIQPTDDHLVLLYIRCFNLSLRCLDLVDKLWQPDLQDQERQAILANCCFGLRELRELGLETEKAKAVRVAEGFILEARGSH